MLIHFGKLQKKSDVSLLTADVKLRFIVESSCFLYAK
jgi:hypothetical protein